MFLEGMRRDSYVFSGLLHLTVALVAFFGLPHFFREPPEIEAPIVVDLVPIGEKTNPPPKQAEAPQPEPPKPQPAPKPEPVKQEAPKPAPPPPPPPKPAEPEPIPVPKPEPKPEPKKPEPKPEPKPQPQQKLSDIKPPPRPQPPADPLDSLLKSVEKPKPNPLDDLLKAADKAKPVAADKGSQPRPQNVRGSDSHNPNEPISMTEMDAIRAHVSKFWNIPAGAKDAEKLVIEIRVSVQPDGSVTDAQVVNGPLLADSFYQAAADSARRAVRLASPLPIPRNKYDQFRDFVLVFNPKQMIMGR